MYLGWLLEGYYGVQSGFIPVTSFKSLTAEGRISPHFIEEGKRVGTQKLMTSTKLPHSGLQSKADLDFGSSPTSRPAKVAHPTACHKMGGT